MVDINLIGDDKGEEKEERTDEFSQTSSFDTQEFTTEDKTETFDTTKTVDYSFKGKSFLSNFSALIIFGIIILLGGAAYFFLTGDKKSGQEQLTTFPENPEEVVETIPSKPESETESPSSTSISSAEIESSTPSTTEIELSRPSTTDIESSTPSTREIEPSRVSTRTETAGPITSQIISTSKTAVNSVTSIMSTMPSNLHTTLISYTGNRLRLEFLAPTKTTANEFSNQLTQNAGIGNFVVLSEDQVATDGQSFEKVLMSGTMTNNELASSVSAVNFINSDEAKDWFQQTARQYDLNIREFKSHRASIVEGYEKIPIFVRIFGSKSSLMDFLNVFANQNLNIELTKILLVSSDMINFLDDNLFLVMNLYLYQAS